MSIRVATPESARSSEAQRGREGEGETAHARENARGGGGSERERRGRGGERRCGGDTHRHLERGLLLGRHRALVLEQLRLRVLQSDENNDMNTYEI